MKYYVGVDLGGTKIAVGVVNENYEIIKQDSIKTMIERKPEVVIDDMANLVKKVIADASLTIEDIEWVGIGSPGSINSNDGIIERANNLRWFNIPIVEMMKQRLNCHVHVENDANAAAYGEYVAGAAKDADISVMITLGTGVGGGIIMNNKIYTGFNFAAAEIGHMVIEFDGRQCTCGRKGCFETFSSATGLINTTIEYMQNNKDSMMWKLVEDDISNVDGRTAFDGKRAGDKTATEVVDKYIKYLSCGVANVINILQPNMLCIGGGISKEGDYLLNPLKELVRSQMFIEEGGAMTEIVIASLQNNAGIIGAALLGLAE